MTKFDPETVADQILANEEQADRASDSYRWQNADILAAALPEGEVTDGEVNEALEVVLAALEARGSGITKLTLRSWLSVARRNPPKVRNGVSLTAAQECGDRPERYTWFATYGASLSKRQVRRLRGDRKLDTVVSTNSTVEARQSKVAELLSDMAADGIEGLVAAYPEIARAVVRAATSAGNKANHDADELDNISMALPGDDLAEYLHNADLAIKRRLQSLSTRDDTMIRGAVLLEVERLELTMSWVRAWAQAHSGSLVSDLEQFLTESEA